MDNPTYCAGDDDSDSSTPSQATPKGEYKADIRSKLDAVRSLTYFNAAGIVWQLVVYVSLWCVAAPPPPRVRPPLQSDWLRAPTPAAAAHHSLDCLRAGFSTERVEASRMRSPGTKGDRLTSWAIPTGGCWCSARWAWPRT
jgi:hypothetical protein